MQKELESASTDKGQAGWLAQGMLVQQQKYVQRYLQMQTVR